MRIVWDPSSAHERHAPEFDSHLGHPIPFYDTPIRLQNVELQLRAVFGNAAFSPYTDHGLEPIRRVHRSDYLYFVKNIYQHWQGLGGNDAGVMPDTFCMHRFARRSIPVQQGLCDAAKSTVEWLQQGVTERLWAFYRTLLNASPAYPPLIQGDAIDEVLAPYGVGNMGFLDGGNPGFYTYDVGAALVSGTWEAAYAAAQVAVSACDELMAADMMLRSTIGAFAMHHAHSAMSGGFCYLNNAAIAAQYLIDRYSRNVVIVDIDYHHGNGTQEIFYEKDNPLFISLHGLPDYPWFSGREDEYGDKEGLGRTINIPLPVNCPEEDYLEALTKVLQRHIIKPRKSLSTMMFPQPMHHLLSSISQLSPVSSVRQWFRKPIDCVVVSLGVDTYEEDPVGCFNITSAGYQRIGEIFGSLGLPTLFVMEGGYHVETIGRNVANVLSGFDDMAKRRSRWMPQK